MIRSTIAWRSMLAVALACLDSVVHAALGMPNLHQAILERRSGDALRMIQAAAVEENDRRGNTPLHYASETDQPEIVLALLQRGADIDARRFDGATPVLAGCVGGATEVVALLRARGAEFSSQACLYAAASWGRAAMVQAMLDQGVKPVGGNAKNETALHLAVARGHVDVAKALVAGGADLKATDADGMTPFETAVVRGQRGTAFVLLAAGVRPDERCCSGKLFRWHSGVSHLLTAQYLEQAGQPQEASGRYVLAADQFDAAAQMLQNETNRLGGSQLSTLGGDFLLHLMAVLGKTTMVMERPSVVAMQHEKHKYQQVAERAQAFSAQCRERAAALR